MTQEDKNFLLKDLCARLPYGVNVLADCDKTFDQGLIGVLMRIEPYVGIKDEYQGKYLLYQYGVFTPSFVDEVRPYLFPLSSMTEEERIAIGNEFAYGQPHKAMDILHKRHIDYRGLIPKGLAIDATGLNIY